MFGDGPTNEQHLALADLVNSHWEVIQLQGERIESLENILNIVTEMARAAQAESHLYKGLLGGLIAEIAGRTDDPYRELADILRRVRFVSREFSIDDDQTSTMIDDAQRVISEYAETYLRRGEAAAR